MHRVMVMLPEEIHAQLKALAKVEGVSVSHYIAYAIACQVDAVEADVQSETSVEKSETQKSNNTGMPSPAIKSLPNNATTTSQATTLGTHSVDVNHL